MGLKELIDACVELVGSYQSAHTTEDVHLDAYLAEHPIANEHEVDFVRQVFNGCVRYRKLLKVLVSAFLRARTSETSRADSHLYTVIGYLAVIRLTDLGFDQFKDFVALEDPFKMLAFLSFLFNQDNLEQWVRAEWSKLYDVNYVENTLIANILSFLPQAELVISRLNERIHGIKDTDRVIKPATVIEPFNITAPRPRRLPAPIKVKVGFKAQPAPATTFSPDQRFQKGLEEEKERNRQAQDEKYSDPKQQPFKFQPMHATRKKEQVVRAIIEEQDRELRFDEPHSRPLPELNVVDTPIKLTAAAVLREEAILRKKQAEDAKLIRAYEAGQHDSIEFYRWQEEMKAKDEAERATDMERRRLEMALSHEEAQAARQRATQEKRGTVLRIKAEKEALAARQMDERRVQDEQRQEVIKGVAEIKESAIQARKRIEREKQKIAASVVEENREMKARKKQEEAEERAQKAEMIREIRALEKVKNNAPKLIDSTATKNNGLLSEMSYVELRERLAVARARDESERNQKRASIIAAKQEKQAALASKVEELARIRQQRAATADSKRVVKRQAQEDMVRAQTAARDDKLIALHEKLESRRAARLDERAHLRRDQEAITQRNRFLAADKEQLEERRYAEMERGAARSAKSRQEARKSLAEQEALVKTRESLVRSNYRESKEAARDELKDIVDAELDQSRAERAPEILREQNLKRAKVTAERERYLKAKQLQEKNAPYTAQVNQAITENIRKSTSTASAGSPAKRKSGRKGC